MTVNVCMKFNVGTNVRKGREQTRQTKQKLCYISSLFSHRSYKHKCTMNILKRLF